MTLTMKLSEGNWNNLGRLSLETVFGTRVSPSVEDKMALNKMEESLRRVGSHYQVAVPWRP